jgi:hypothetical protein
MHYLGAVMTAIPSISIASSTSPNWLAEAQTALQATDGGMMGALQTASTASTGPAGSIKSFLATSQSNADAFASIAQSSVQAAGQFYAQLAATEGQQAAQDRQAKEAALLDPPAQTNFTPPRELDPVVYYDDGSSLNTTSNIMTLSNGSQIDITTGLPYVDPKSVITMANGAYLDITNNILHEADGTRIDATTGLTLSTSA